MIQLTEPRQCIVGQVVLPCHAARDQLHAARDFTIATILHQQMNVIRRDEVVEHTQPETFTGLEQPVQPAAPVACELEQELPLVTAMRNVPDVAGEETTVDSRHPLDGSDQRNSPCIKHFLRCTK